MKVLALIGSPRKGSNTDILVDEILEGCKEKGFTVEKLYLYDVNISACTDCRFCKSENYECAIKDDMQQIYSSMVEADILIFGTPVYWYGPTAKMKLLIDRMRPFIASKKMQGKKGVLVAPSEEGPKACKALLEMFRMSFEYLGIEFVDSILSTAYERAEVSGNKDDLKKAHELGISL
ncbi:MAG: flavodoxin family protein [Planctomycetota bacterium]|jgi:multimeric flavodoxin WrbA